MGSYKLKGDCMICLFNEYNYWVKLDCNHGICSDCFAFIKKCPLRCNESINLSKIKIYKLSTE